jgi:hypothetical protein
MNKQTVARCLADLTEDVAHMDDDAQESFARLLPVLSKLYRRDAKAKGILLLSDDTQSAVFHINADEFEAYAMIVEAMPKHTALLMRDAPESGAFN